MNTRQAKRDRRESASFFRGMFAGNRSNTRHGIYRKGPNSTLRALAASGMLMLYNH